MTATTALASSYPTPSPEYTTVTETVTVQAVRNGSVFKGQTVGSKKVGPKWTVLLDSDGNRVARLENGTEVEVTRQETTKESGDATYRAIRNRQLAEALASRTDGVKGAQAKLNEDLDRVEYAGYSAVGHLLGEQAKLKLWNQLAYMADNAEEGVDLVELRNQLAERLTTQLVTDVRHNALSRSSSVVSNLLDDCDREAMAKFIDEARWY